MTLFEYGVSRGKVFAFFFGFVFMFVLAALQFAVVVGPILALQGAGICTVISAAVGCGVGTAIVGAFVFVNAV